MKVSSRKYLTSLIPSCLRLLPNFRGYMELYPFPCFPPPLAADSIYPGLFHPFVVVFNSRQSQPPHPHLHPAFYPDVDAPLWSRLIGPEKSSLRSSPESWLCAETSAVTKQANPHPLPSLSPVTVSYLTLFTRVHGIFTSASHTLPHPRPGATPTLNPFSATLIHPTTSCLSHSFLSFPHFMTLYDCESIQRL